MAEPHTFPADRALTVPWQQTLVHASNRSHLLGLLDAPNAEALVQGLGPQEVYQAIKALGPSDAVPVLALLSGSQTQALLDMDVWHRHNLDLSDVLTWMEAFREAGIECLQRAARALDQEALSLLFRRRLLITLTPKDDASDQAPIPDWAVEPPDEITPLITTPDGRFIIAARVRDEWEEPDGELLEEEERKAILYLVSQLYLEEDWAYVSDMLRGAESDLSSTLEEDALRFRDARMEDLGFPPLMRALEVYGPLDPRVLRSDSIERYPSLDHRLPAAYAQPLARGLFHEAMLGLSDAETVHRIEADLVPLANSALVADGAEPGEIEHLQDTLSRTRGYIELALAYGTAAGPERLETATHRIAAHHVSVLFRVGYTLTLRAATRARALASRTCFEQDSLPMNRLEEVERAVLDGLRAKRPRVSQAVDGVVEALLSGGRVPKDWQLNVQAGDTERAFLQPEDLEAVHHVLSDLEGLAEALDARGPALAKAAEYEAALPVQERTAQVFINTALAHQLLGRAPELRPLSASDLPGLISALAAPELDLEALQSALIAWFGAGQTAVGRRVTLGLQGLKDTLLGLSPEEVDPRFVEGLLVESGPR